jgi:O-antigen/teichoic acid export membrane protein
VPPAGSATKLTLTRGKLRFWGRQSALSLLDQAMTSASSFGISILLARSIRVESFGAFTLAFSMYLFVSGFHNVLLLEPLTVMGSSEHWGRLGEYFRAQVVVHLVLTGLFSAVVLLTAGILRLLVPHSALAGAMLGSGLALPFLLLLWLARRMCYVVQRPGIAALGATSYLTLVAAGMFLLRRFNQTSSLSTFLLMGCGSLLTSFLLLRHLGVLKSSAGDARISWRYVLRQNWTYGRWLTLTTLLSWVSVQVQIFLTASLLGLTSAGILRAMQLPSMAMAQIISATSLLVLPSLARELRRRNFVRLHQKAVLASAFLGTLGLLFAIGLFLFSRQAEQLLYSGRFKSFAWAIPLLAFVPVFTGCSSSFSYALRTLGKSRYELLAYVLSAFTAVFSSVLLLPHWGLRGAVASLVASTAVLAAAVYYFYQSQGYAGNGEDDPSVCCSEEHC